MLLAEAGSSGAEWDAFRPCRLLQKLQRTARVVIRSNRGRHLLRLAKSLKERKKGDSEKNRRKPGEFEDKEKRFPKDTDTVLILKTGQKC